MCLDCSAVLLWFRARWSDAVTDKDLSLPWPIRQSPLSGTWEGSVTCSPTPSLQEWKFVCVCAKAISFFLFLFFLLKSVVFCIMTMCSGVYAFPLICTLLLCPLWVDVLVALVTQSSYTEPVSTPITSTTLVCWNGWRLLFNVLLLLDSRQLYSVSTVPVEPLGLALETSVSYQHYWCSVSVDLWSLPLSGIRHPVSFLCLRFSLSHPFFNFLLPVSPYLLFSLIWFKKSLF